MLRAIQFEASSGCIVIPEDIRDSRLYSFLFSRHPPAFQQRLEKIVEANKKIPKNWKMKLPDFDSHLDEIGVIEEGDDETELSSYEEE